jgi:preprotein translocase subunit SecF
MFVVRHRLFFFILTGLLLVGAVLALIVWPPQFSIDFTGGSLVDVNYTSTRPSLDEVKGALNAIDMTDASVRESGGNGIALRTHTLSPEEHNAVLSALSLNGTAPLTEGRFTSIGPSLGNELSKKAFYALLAVIFAIVLYIAWAFRKLSRPVPGWGYGLIAVFMLAIDVIVPAGFFAVYAHYTGAQIDTLFVIALLALLGYCINDVIVIFDRVREHLGRNEKSGQKQSFDELVGRSITETLGRSINTALTVVLALLALLLIGSETTRTFALVMLVGVVAGTFSSICRSAPLLIPIANWIAKRS